MTTDDRSPCFEVVPILSAKSNVTAKQSALAVEAHEFSRRRFSAAFRQGAAFAQSLLARRVLLRHHRLMIARAIRKLLLTLGCVVAVSSAAAQNVPITDVRYCQLASNDLHSRLVPRAKSSVKNEQCLGAWRRSNNSWFAIISLDANSEDGTSVEGVMFVISIARNDGGEWGSFAWPTSPAANLLLAHPLPAR